MRQFLPGNPGVAARFPVTIEFPRYNGEELTAIFSAGRRRQDSPSPPKPAIKPATCS
jgi:hypothetical protein